MITLIRIYQVTFWPIRHTLWRRHPGSSARAIADIRAGRPAFAVIRAAIGDWGTGD
jgi:hypothetical protein